MHVERADQVADPLPAVVGRAVPLGPAAPGPAAAVPGAEALRPLLVEADHDPVFGLLAVEREDPRRLRLVVGVGALLPAPGPLQRDPVAGEDPAQVRGRDLQPLPDAGSGTAWAGSSACRAPRACRDGRRRPRRSAASSSVEIRRGRPPPKRGRSESHPCWLNSWITLRTCDSSVSSIRAICRRAHQRVRRQQDQRPLPRRRHASTSSTTASTAAPHAAPTHEQTPPADASTPPQVGCVPIRHQHAEVPPRFRSNVPRRRTRCWSRRSCAAWPRSARPCSPRPGRRSCRRAASSLPPFACASVDVGEAVLVAVAGAGAAVPVLGRPPAGTRRRGCPAGGSAG